MLELKNIMSKKESTKGMSKTKLFIGTKLTRKSMTIRGVLISMTILLEDAIDRWLVKYFSSNETRQNELFRLVFCHDRISFSSKCAVFVYIVNKHCVEFKKQYPNINKHLVEIYEDRNILAHSIMDLNKDYESRDSTNYTKRKSIDETNKSFSNKDLVEKVDRISMYLDAINDLVHPPLN